MSLSDIVSFQKDLLFEGAVQLGWLEDDPERAEKAAVQFAFHGPQYHGVSQAAYQDDGHQLVDTARFTLDILERITGRRPDQPFALAIAGYGTGKSHLAITLTFLLRNPSSPIAKRILSNIATADQSIAEKIGEILGEQRKPFLVVAINGMKESDLTGEIIRQVMLALREKGLDTSPLEELRPRFRSANNFTASFFDALKDEFLAEFGADCSVTDILERLQRQDETAFQKVNAIYERKMGASIRMVGQESLHEFVRVARESYCGEGKPFAGIVILFDEFGHYLQFAVLRPQIAGPGSPQQLFEAVQANSEGVFLVGFIQFELRAYISRMSAELRDELERYSSRYDGVRKVRLSTNLETLIANLLKKNDEERLSHQLTTLSERAETIQGYMRRWFPELDNHAVWANIESFERMIRRGCWPLHPLSTWLLYRLASVGRSLHQRSALSLLADAFDKFNSIEPPAGFTLAPVDLCSEELIADFLATESFGQQGPSAQAYRSVIDKYQQVLSSTEISVLKAVLLLSKVGARIQSREEWIDAIARFAGQTKQVTLETINTLERDRAALGWNGAAQRFELLTDGVPYSKFLDWLQAKAAEVPAFRREELFSMYFGRWFPERADQSTDFGIESEILTKEWNYSVYFANVGLLSSQIDFAVSGWLDARAVDEPKGQLIYCYVGPGSDLTKVQEQVRTMLKERLGKAGVSLDTGAPIAVCFLHDQNGAFVSKVAEYSILRGQLDPADSQRYANYIAERKINLEQELQNQFDELRKQRHVVFATSQEIAPAPLKSALTKLFAAVYPHRIPFPFDGITTRNGVAVHCSKMFTRQLFLGALDKGFIDGCTIQEKNRADRVLVKSWDIFDADGRLRTRPGNRAVRDLIDLLESWLKTETDDDSAGQFNLGHAFKTLCLPPYACNIASAGLVLGLFFGSRKDHLVLLKGGQRVSTEIWLQSAMPGNYLDLSALTDTVVLQTQGINEWQRLLNDWGLETSYSGREAYLQKAYELGDRLQIPEGLYYWYDNLRSKAKDALDKLADHEKKLNEALEKVNRGLACDDAGFLSWGAAELARLRKAMREEENRWTQEQIAEVERHEAEARAKTQETFPTWLPQQRETSIGQMEKFIRKMENIGNNLTLLGLTAEKAALESHVEIVRDHLEFLGRAIALKTDVNSFVRVAVVNDSTSIGALNDLLSKIEEYQRLINEARLRNVELVRSDLDSAQIQLAQLRDRCREQLKRHKEDLEELLLFEICSLSDIQTCRAKVGDLIRIFAGQEQNLEDLYSATRELDLVEGHFRQLDDDHLTDEEFESLLERNRAETNDAFAGECPFLIDPYDEIASTIRARRRRVADAWMRSNVPDIASLESARAEKVRDLLARLHNPPRLLSAQERAKVDQAIAACEERLDKLEIDGLLARFRGLPEPGRMEFLKKLRSQGFMNAFCSRCACDDHATTTQQVSRENSGSRCPLLST